MVDHRYAESVWDLLFDRIAEVVVGAIHRFLAAAGCPLIARFPEVKAQLLWVAVQILLCNILGEVARIGLAAESLAG